jgi:hypothetical protein
MRFQFNEYSLVRNGLVIGAIAIFAASAFMNVSGWVAAATTLPQAVANGSLSFGMELIGVTSLAWSGFQMSNARWGRALLALGIGLAIIYFNTMATENFLSVQNDLLLNTIEMDGQVTMNFDAELSTRQSEIDSIIEQNGGTIPRPADVVEQSYSHLDPDKNPINMRNKDAEIGLRLRYDELTGEMSELREARIAPAVGANDTARSVVTGNDRTKLIWTVEAFKAAAFLILGRTRIISFEEKKRRRKWAAIRKNQQNAKPSTRQP